MIVRRKVEMIGKRMWLERGELEDSAGTRYLLKVCQFVYTCVVVMVQNLSRFRPSKQ